MRTATGVVGLRAVAIFEATPRVLFRNATSPVAIRGQHRFSSNFNLCTAWRLALRGPHQQAHFSEVERAHSASGKFESIRAPHSTDFFSGIVADGS